MNVRPIALAGLKSSIAAKFSAVVGLPEEALVGKNLTLREIIGAAPGMTNSVDLMEAFAKTANWLRKEHGLRVRLPTLPLETPIADVLDAFMAEAEREIARQGGEPDDPSRVTA